MDSAPQSPPALPALLVVEADDRPVRPTGAELAAVLARIGADGDRFAIVERDSEPRNSQVFIQAWRWDDGMYELEHREGAAERHFGALLEGPERVTELVLDWIRDGAAWRGAVDWDLVDLTTTPELDDKLRDEAEQSARLLVRGGFLEFAEVAAALQDEHELTAEQAARIVAGPWEQRRREQESWPAVTDPDRLAEAFNALEAGGVTARMNFTCCGSCGRAEIGAEAAEGAHGFAFFHSQDTDRVAEGGPLWLAYGHFVDAPGGVTTAEVGAEVVAALTAAGLRAEWNGSPEKAIRVTGLEWRKRLPEDRRLLP